MKEKKERKELSYKKYGSNIIWNAIAYALILAIVVIAIFTICSAIMAKDYVYGDGFVTISILDKLESNVVIASIVSTVTSIGVSLLMWYLGVRRTCRLYTTDKEKLPNIVKKVMIVLVILTVLYMLYEIYAVNMYVESSLKNCEKVAEIQACKDVVNGQKFGLYFNQIFSTVISLLIYVISVPMIVKKYLEKHM